jgi:hypothetical protein
MLRFLENKVHFEDEGNKIEDVLAGPNSPTQSQASFSWALTLQCFLAAQKCFSKNDFRCNPYPRECDASAGL